MGSLLQGFYGQQTSDLTLHQGDEQHKDSEVAGALS